MRRMEMVGSVRVQLMRVLLRRLLLFVVCACCLAWPVHSTWAQQKGEPTYRDKDAAFKSITQSELSQIIKYLASPKLEGRGCWEKGGIAAADLFCEQFEKSNLKPIGDEGTFKQAFSYTYSGKSDWKSSNVVGMAEGSDEEFKGEYIVFGAHYDHLGLKRKGQFWPGADDNASGTAAVMELAEAFGRCELRPKRSMIFALFGAEERGLYGSQHFAEHSPVPVEKIVAMINLDMIGRNKANEVWLIGAATSPDLDAQINEANKTLKLKLLYDPATDIADSDHYNFYLKNIPVVFLHGGLHNDYHKPADTAEKIVYPKVLATTQLAFLTGWSVAETPERPKFQKLPEGAAGGRLGIIAAEIDEAMETELGLKGFTAIRVADVIKGSPADKIALKKDDIIIEFDGKRFPEDEGIVKFKEYVKTAKKDKPTKMVVVRDKKRGNVTVVLK
ncbi:MAG: M20/M25/M40 family metallo-hydrolase [Planctomycetota bacterium]|nr:M20/M25/M40 family metallo-hydrolase [Planctomycetota bacterium]